MVARSVLCSRTRACHCVKKEARARADRVVRVCRAFRAFGMAASQSAAV
jgi:hypothetical protein